MSEQADIHARLMSRYAQVPDWWYLVIFCAHIASDMHFSESIEPNLLSRVVVMFAFGVICIKVWEVDLPVWGLVLALAVGKLDAILDTPQMKLIYPSSVLLHHTHRDDSSYHESASGAEVGILMHM